MIEHRICGISAERAAEMMPADRLSQFSGPGGVVFASCPITSPIRSQITSPVVVASCPEIIGMAGAFLPGPVAIAFEHQVRHAPDVDLGYHANEARHGLAYKGLGWKLARLRSLRECPERAGDASLECRR